MKKYLIGFFVWVGVATAQPLLPTDTLRVASYNVLNFPGSTGLDRAGDFRTVINTIEPDVIATQEMLSAAGVQTLLDSVFNHETAGKYNSATFIDGPDTDSIIFYRPEVVTLSSQSRLTTALRNIAEFVFSTADGQELRIYSLHLKASQGAENEDKRLAEATILRDHLNDLPANSNFIVLGDFNIYKASEPAYSKFTGSEADECLTRFKWKETGTTTPLLPPFIPNLRAQRNSAATHRAGWTTALI